MVSIEINPETSLQHIQQVISKSFPFLKLEFFHKPHGKNEGSSKKEMITDVHTHVGAYSSLAMDVVLVIHHNMPVAELEKLFEEKLHLHVQVFYKSSNLWLESILSDNLSLQELNDKAKERNEKIVEETDLPDYHEQE